MPNTIKKNGTIDAFNVSPKGFYEGLLLKNGSKTVQINFPQEFAMTVAEIASVGDTVHATVTAEESHGEPVHPVFRLVSLTAEQTGREFSLAHSDSDGMHSFTGKIERLNYALHGEVNGAILDSGDFLHLRPEGARAAELKVGLEVNGRGSRKPMIGGHSVIEASEVNGIQIEPKAKAKKKHAAKHTKHHA